jgi:hypothetical protein
MKLERILLSAVALGLFAACDPARPVDLTPLPPYLLKKTDFASDLGWYYQATMFEVPADVNPDGLWTWFPTPLNPVLKLRWEFKENYLVAYRTNSRFTATTDSEALSNEVKPDLVFPCQHLDVFLDQLVDAPKRPWYEREYVLVDWSASQHGRGVDSPRYLEMDENAFEQERMWVSDPKDPDAPRFDFDKGYLEVTVRAHLKQEHAANLGIDKRNDCYDLDAVPCGPRQVSWRMAFVKVPETDYQPLEISPAVSNNIFPVYRTGQLHFDDNYGFTDQGIIRYGRRFNLWEKTRAADGTLVPYGSRSVRQRPLFLSANFPRELLPEVQDSLGQWNLALRATVDSLRRIDCEDQGGGAGCATLPQEATDPFVLCPNNPVEPTDPAICGPAGKTPKLGDFRDLQLVWSEINGPRHPAALGFFISDPETGEAFSGVVILEAPLIDRGVAATVDAINLLNGVPVIPSDFYEGRLTAQHVDQARRAAGTVSQSLSTGPGANPLPPPPQWEPGKALTETQLFDRYQRVQTGWVTSPTRPSGLFPAKDFSEQAEVRARPLLDRLSAEAEISNGRRAALRGTSIEAMVMDAEARLTAGVVPTGALTAAELERASPLRGRWWEHTPTAVDPYCADFLFADPDLDVLAQKYRGKSYQEIFTALRKDQVHQLLLHEIGHVLGFRHNFAASYDAFNYPDRYWELRNDGNVGPRYRDPLTAAEKAGGIRNFQYSSVMDYLPNFTYQGAGLGKYDKAAVKWLYGSLVEVLDGPKNIRNAPLANELNLWTRGFAPTPLISSPDKAIQVAHYTDLPRLFDLSNRSDFPANRLVNFYGNPAVVSRNSANATPDGRVMVPYRSCTDELNNTFTSCQWLDHGADVYEVVEDAIARERGYYFFTHFRRGLLGFPAVRSSLLPSQTLTTLDLVSVYSTYWMAVLNDPSLFTPQEGLGSIPQALVAAVDYLGEKVTTPDVGGYSWTPNGDGTQSFKKYYPFSGTGAASLSLDLSQARHFRTQLLDPFDFGSYWYEQTKLVGYAGDKYAALRVLTEGASITSFGLETVRDPRKSVAAFHRFFEKEMDSWFGAMLAHDYSRFAPVWNGVRLLPAPISDASWSGNGQAMVDPMTPLSVELNAVAQGLVNLHQGYTTYAFADSARLWLAGSGEQLTAPLKISFTDLTTGKIYEAISYPDGAGRETGIAARMLRHANTLQQRTTVAATQPERDLARAELDDYRFLLEVTRLTSQTIQSTVH